VEPGNLDELSHAIRKALADPEDLLKKGMASYQMVLDRANIDVMAKVFTEVMNHMYGGRL
jgi:hypothetical protein